MFVGGISIYRWLKSGSQHHQLVVELTSIENC